MQGTEFLIYQHADDELDRIPVVLMSAGAQLQQLGPKLNVVATLPKPFDFEHLLTIAGRYCRRTHPGTTGTEGQLGT